MAEKGKPEGLDKIDLATLANYRLVERLAESERRYQELLDDLPDVVVRRGGIFAEGYATMLEGYVGRAILCWK